MRLYRSSRLAPLVLLLCMGAALGQSAAVGPASTLDTAALARFDGSYYGAFETTQASGKGCGAGHNHQMTIKDGRITMVYNAMKRLEGTITPSGAIAAAGGDTRLTGTLSTDIVTGETWNGDCAYRFALKRRG
jgi:hypothetical protein